jgi:hypothetical protein
VPLPASGTAVGIWEHAAKSTVNHANKRDMTDLRATVVPRDLLEPARPIAKN